MLKTFYLSVFLVKITQGISQRDKQDKKNRTSFNAGKALKHVTKVFINLNSMLH